MGGLRSDSWVTGTYGGEEEKFGSGTFCWLSGNFSEQSVVFSGHFGAVRQEGRRENGWCLCVLVGCFGGRMIILTQYKRNWDII